MSNMLSQAQKSRTGVTTGVDFSNFDQQAPTADVLPYKADTSNTMGQQLSMRTQLGASQQGSTVDFSSLPRPRGSN